MTFMQVNLMASYYSFSAQVLVLMPACNWVVLEVVTFV